MRAKPPENFRPRSAANADRYGVAGHRCGRHLRALDWEDYETRMKELLRLHYGAVNLKEARAPREMRRRWRAISRAISIASRPSDGASPARRSSRRSGALPKIPAGTTMSYGALAAKIEMPSAVRAVGHANGSNPISVVLPCHRLIGANGSLVKYGGGLERKRWLLQHEGVEFYRSRRKRYGQASIAATPEN